MKLDDNMKKIREEAYIAACKDYEHGLTVHEVCTKHGMSESAFYAWKKTFYGLSLDRVQSIKKEVKEERRLKRKVQEQELVIKALRAALKKKF